MRDLSELYVSFGEVDKGAELTDIEGSELLCSKLVFDFTGRDK